MQIFNTGIIMRVLNFKENSNLTLENTDLPRGLLSMILWAGDMVHDGISDVERLPTFDVYLCYGYDETLQANIDYLNSRMKPGLICILDYNNESQMNRFVELFHNRFGIIDSDYNGNTPSLPLKYYRDLLSDDGKAFNMKGIQGCHFPTEDYQNMLELFAPMLSTEHNNKRSWTRDILYLAECNNLSPSATWTSPDLKQPYYNKIREDQERFLKQQDSRNPNRSRSYLYTRDNIEEYWATLPDNVLTVNMERVASIHNEFQEYVTLNLERFKSFLTILTEPLLENKLEFLQYIRHESIYTLQKIYGICKEYPGVNYEHYYDMRKNTNTYGYSLTYKK